MNCSFFSLSSCCALLPLPLALQALAQNSPTSFFLYYDWLQRSVCARLPCMALLFDPRLHCMLPLSLLLVVLPGILYSAPVLAQHLFSFPLQTSICITHKSCDCALDKQGSLKLDPFPLLSCFGVIGATFLRCSFVIIFFVINAIWTDPHVEDKQEISDQLDSSLIRTEIVLVSFI